MKTTKTVEIYDLFLTLITDTDMCKMAEEDIKHNATNYLKFSISEFKQCKKNLVIGEDENGEQVIMDELDLEEQTVLAYGCVYYWLHSKVLFNKLMKQRINTKDYNQSSPANILLRMNELLDFFGKKFLRLRKSYGNRDFKGFN